MGKNMGTNGSWLANNRSCLVHDGELVVNTGYNLVENTNWMECQLMDSNHLRELVITWLILVNNQG